MRAIVLINVETGDLKSVFHDLIKLHEVREAHLTFGPYDAVAMIETEDLNKIGRIVEFEIQPIPGVLKTLTCLMVEEELPIPERGAFEKTAETISGAKSIYQGAQGV